jgi:hypothetical protein
MEFEITYWKDGGQTENTIEVCDVNNILDAIMKCYIRVGVVNIVKIERID